MNTSDRKTSRDLTHRIGIRKQEQPTISISEDSWYRYHSTFLPVIYVMVLTNVIDAVSFHLLMSQTRAFNFSSTILTLSVGIV